MQQFGFMICGESCDVSKVRVNEEQSSVMFGERNCDLAFDSEICLWLLFVEDATVPKFWRDVEWWYRVVV